MKTEEFDGDDSELMAVNGLMNLQETEIENNCVEDDAAEKCQTKEKCVDSFSAAVSNVKSGKIEGVNENESGYDKGTFDVRDGTPNLDDFDVEAFLERIRSDPAMAKAMAKKMDQWERELFGGIDVEAVSEPRLDESVPDICPTTPPPPEPPPGSLLSELADHHPQRTYVTSHTSI